MPDLFSPFTLKDVTLRNRIGMSPMTMYHSVDGKMDDYHLMYLGARAAGGFGLVIPEQVAIAPDGRTSVHCAGIWEDAQVEGHARVTAMIKKMGGVAGIQLGHTGRNGSEQPPWAGWGQISPDEPDGWQVRGPSDIPYGAPKRPFPVHPLSVEEIQQLHRQYADAARRAADAGYEWLEMHFAHGYLASSFFSPLANQRQDAYGGSLENRARFLLEALDAVRAVWPERLPLTMRLGSDDFHPDGVQFDEAVTAIGWMAEHGLDMADVSQGGNTDDMRDPIWNDPSAWVARAARVKREVGIPVATSWNLGVPANADAAVRSGDLDLVLLGRPALANPHWPVWAARELGHPEPFRLLPPDTAFWLENFRGHGPSIGWPEPAGVPAPNTVAEEAERITLAADSVPVPSVGAGD
ncbi:NADH:flavin oxidoreductase/NADH oxidase [Modestobacter sp. I12A-02628]|uniref:NADH:flavin oxidoreductase/NADH oxidase n=1 Tax=Goekera deserti TaxID=2497753 RepID=A0A7K3WE23_9ACTN|nr:NADH:flavin oxidoreductase/NADH oxidase [Goekera deserti]MPQ98374.1 NADH:flavin oxidoreductase/NADH oxidase [Goekera deserti]NDI48201.1 NADH:flavin oxidoreductase/NADH oxidase [Goekera deserti]NEL53950.1 NADH:flavin oxidoreductase/NADH oxidase [Goekera deserti]